MRKYTRGEFLKLGAALAGAAGLTRLPLGRQAIAQGGARQAPRVPAGVEPDPVVVNARVLTRDPALPRAEALAVKDGRFLAVGSSADVRNLASRRSRVLDA